jgi:hypothetical protein
MDIGGRVTHGAITEEQLSKLSALTHRDVGNAVNAGAFLLPVVCIKLRFINAKNSPYDPHGCRKCLKLLRTILAYAWYGGMLRMCSLFSMLEWSFPP